MTKPKIYWRGDQWQVTTFGLETIDRSPRTRCYQHRIKSSELADVDKGYVQYLKEKGWVWIDEFLEGLEQAKTIHTRLKELRRSRAKAKRDRKTRTANKGRSAK